MPSFRQYLEIFSLEPTDAFVVDRIGVGTAFIDNANVFPDEGDFLINANNTLLVPGFWGLQSSLGVFTGTTLPQLSTLPAPTIIEIGDLDNMLGVNNLTVNAHAGDLISDHGVTASTYTMRISNTAVRFIVNTVGGYWATMPFGT